MSECNQDLLDTDGENRAVRCFLMFYGDKVTSKVMKENMELCGFPYAPDWVKESPGHLTKAGAQLWLRMLFDLEKSTPPQEPERKPLTDGRIIDIADDFKSQQHHGGHVFDHFDYFGFARAVEAAHGIPQAPATPSPSGQEKQTVLKDSSITERQEKQP